MALTTKANVLAIAPNLSTISDDTWALFLADVENHISQSVFGAKTEEAARYWVAHYLTLIKDSSLASASGPIVKERVGDVMREYAKVNNLSSSEKDYSRTGYGQKFLTIRKSTIVCFGVTVPGV
jgi:hypothetical protein